MNSQTNISFLFGSGVSIPANFPSTTKITQRVLSGKDISRHSDTTYWNGPPIVGEPDEYVPKVISFINALKAEVDQYYSFNPMRTTNYEDIYSIASQIHDNESGEYDNPAIGALIHKISSEYVDVITGTPYDPNDTWRLIDITSETVNFIRDVVWIELSKKPDTMDYLNFLHEAIEDPSIGKKIVFTLNHDTLLETFLESKSIHFVDGFGSPDSALRKWQPQSFINATSDILLLKLHGSINWFFFENEDSYTLAIPLKEFWEKYPTGYPIKGQPEILVGTLNKILQYSNSIYMDLQCAFNHHLRNCTCLVIAGYSFGDKAINNRIVQWMDSTPTGKIIVVHPDPTALREQARPAININWSTWQKSNRLAIFTKQIQDVLWTEIKSALQ